MPVSRMVARTYSAPSADNAHNCLARLSPTRSMMFSIRSENPGATKPALRPDAFQAIFLASSTTTDQPARTISRATVRPASPPPITQTSTSAS